MSLEIMLLSALLHYMQEHEMLDSIEGALKRVMRGSADGQSGVYHQVTNHAQHLMSHYDLQDFSRAPGAYGASELQLILSDIFRRLPTGALSKSLLQRLALVQTCFLTGLRIGSLVTSDREDEWRLGMRQEDVSFTVCNPDSWTLTLSIRHQKGFSSPEDSHTVRVQMRPLQEARNILLELTVVFLVLLIQ